MGIVPTMPGRAPGFFSGAQDSLADVMASVQRVRNENAAVADGLIRSGAPASIVELQQRLVLLNDACLGLIAINTSPGQ